MVYIVNKSIQNGVHILVKVFFTFESVAPFPYLAANTDEIKHDIHS